MSAEIKTLKQAREIIARLEGDIRSLESRDKWKQAALDKAQEAARLAEEKYNSVIERADVQQEYDTLFDALSEYQCYGWPDRLDLALRMTR